MIPQETHVFSQCSDTSSKADDEHDKPNQDEEESNVEDDIKYCLKLERFSTRPSVHDSIDTNLNNQRFTLLLIIHESYPHQQQTQDPEDEVEEEHGVLDASGDVGEATGNPSASPHS